MRVTERLASLFVQENLEDRELLADQTNQFLQVNLEEKRRQLSAHDGRLAEWRRASTGLLPSDMAAEHEVLVESYRSLLRKADEARLAVNLERRQIGEQFKILEGARMPERPIGPNRALVTFRGALIGLLAGALMSPVSAAWRRRRSS
jgi:LPS O-antigen subunit length determinant protein (WzzB/FepE family)